MKLLKVLLPVLLISAGCCAQKITQQATINEQTKIIAGAERINVYLPLIKGKTVGIFANQTSMVGNTHLVDTLRKLGVDIKVIFGPEHGFRGTADAGEKVGNYIDEKTGINVVSSEIECVQKSSIHSLISYYHNDEPKNIAKAIQDATLIPAYKLREEINRKHKLFVDNLSLLLKYKNEDTPD